MEYEPIIPPEIIKQPEVDSEFDPESKKKKKRRITSLFIKKTAPGKTEAEYKSADEIAPKTAEPLNSSQDLEQTELTAEIPSKQLGDRTAPIEISKFRRGENPSAILQNANETPTEQILTKGTNQLNVPERTPVSESEDAKEDIPADHIATLMGGGGVNPPPPPRQPVPPGGGREGPSRANLTAIAPNIIRKPEQVLLNQRRRLGTFILGVLTGVTVEHIKHRWREKRQFRDTVREQKINKAKVESLENQLYQEQNKKVMPSQEAQSSNTIPGPELAANPPQPIEKKESPEQTRAKAELEAALQSVAPSETVPPPPTLQPESTKLVMPELTQTVTSETDPSAIEAINEMGGVGPEARRTDLKSAAVKEDAGIVTADIVHPVIETEIQRRTIGTFEGNDTIAPPRQLVIKQYVRAGISILILAILLIILVILIK